jgi:hypothetical protein
MATRSPFKVVHAAIAGNLAIAARSSAAMTGERLLLCISVAGKVFPCVLVRASGRGQGQRVLRPSFASTSM